MLCFVHAQRSVWCIVGYHVQHPGVVVRPGGAPREAWTTRLEREDRSLGIEVT